MQQGDRRWAWMAALGVLSLVLALVLPLSGWMLDGLFALHAVLGVVLFARVLATHDTRAFSSVPSALLLLTLFRVVLEVAATRAILSRAHAGALVHTFGSFVSNESVTVGLAAFAIVALVQYVVVARGAERVSEVAARFSLDALPGAQLAITQDIRAGLLSPRVAESARADLVRESHFLGAMDGAMKFVRGDAMLAPVIVLVHAVAGTIVGVFERHMTAREALHTYALLGVGEGLLTQLPSLLVTVAAGLVVTRGRNQAESISSLVSRQWTDSSMAWVTACGVCVLLAFVPGAPWWLLSLLSIACAGVAWNAWRRERSFKQAAFDAVQILVPGPQRGDLSWQMGVVEKLTALGQIFYVQCPHVEFVTHASNEVVLKYQSRELYRDAWNADRSVQHRAMVSAVQAVLERFVSLRETHEQLHRLESRERELVRAVVPARCTVEVVASLRRALLREEIPSRLDVLLECVLELPEGASVSLILEQARRRLVCRSPWVETLCPAWSCTRDVASDIREGIKRGDSSWGRDVVALLPSHTQQRDVMVFVDHDVRDSVARVLRNLRTGTHVVSLRDFPEDFMVPTLGRLEPKP